MTPDDAFKELTRRAGAILRESGFKGAGQNFKRDRGEIWQGVNFQRTQCRLNRIDPIHFTLNLCVHFPKVRKRRLVPVAKSFDRYSPMKSDLQIRAGDFLRAKGEEWWDVGGGNLEVLSKRFTRLMSRVVVPAMDSLATRDGVVGYCRRSPWEICLVVRAWLGKDAPPMWNPLDRDAGLWKKDADGSWWGPGEW